MASWLLSTDIVYVRSVGMFICGFDVCVSGRLVGFKYYIVRFDVEYGKSSKVK